MEDIIPFTLDGLIFAAVDGRKHLGTVDSDFAWPLSGFSQGLFEILSYALTSSHEITVSLVEIGEDQVVLRSSTRPSVP